MKRECEKKPGPPKTQRVPRHNGQRTHIKEHQITSLPICTASEQTWSLPGKAIHQFFKCNMVKNLTEQRQHIATRTVGPYQNYSCSCIYQWQVRIGNPLLGRNLYTEFPEPAYQDFILFQDCKRRLDLPHTIFLSSALLHNSERTMIANWYFFFFF